MPKRSSRDENQAAFNAVEELLSRSENASTPEKNPAAVALGRLGGVKGGAARAKALSARRRKQIAAKAAQARWSKGKR
jgi:hypothetical protein